MQPKDFWAVLENYEGKVMMTIGSGHSTVGTVRKHGSLSIATAVFRPDENGFRSTEDVFLDVHAVVTIRRFAPEVINEAE